MKISDLVPWTDHPDLPIDSLRLRRDEASNSAYAERFRLDEGLITSLPIRRAISTLSKSFPGVKVSRQDDAIAATVGSPTPEVVHKLLQTANAIGWFLASLDVDDDQEAYRPDQLDDAIGRAKVGVVLYLEAKYDLPYEPSVRFLYHLCPARRLDKILSIGLVPKSGSRRAYHPKRVYLAFSERNAMALLDDVRSADRFVEGRSGWVLLKADVEGLRYLRLYHDPNFKVGKRSLGVYTLSGIPPNRLSVVKNVA